VFEIKTGSENEIRLLGRFDASQADTAKKVFNEVNETTIIDFLGLDYISSMGLGVLLMTQKRLKESDKELILKNLNDHVREVFKYAGFDMIFRIE
jgi:anti-sigma B factor antagonist